METTDAFRGLVCTDCGSAFEPAGATHRCPDCGGILHADYDLDRVDLSAGLASRRFEGLTRYESLLPFPADATVSMAEGTTPLVDCPDLAADLGVGTLLLKDEGRNPTGTFKDRGQAVAVTAASQHGATDVALPSAGNAGQAAAAYAARAGLAAHVFVPSRAPFVTKAMINVHGGDMTVVGGRLPDAADAFREAREGTDWHSLASFETPYRHEGKKTLLYEMVEQLDWRAPDAVVFPTGGGVGLVGIHKAATELLDLGLIEERPRLYAAQAAGCAPLVDAWEAGRAAPEPWDHPDTICGGLEVPHPDGGTLVLEALRESGGGAIATPDRDILESATALAGSEGLEVGATAGAATSGARALAEAGEFGPDETVVVVNTGAAAAEADVLRSHLMSQGV